MKPDPRTVMGSIPVAAFIGMIVLADVGLAVWIPFFWILVIAIGVKTSRWADPVG